MALVTAPRWMAWSAPLHAWNRKIGFGHFGRTKLAPHRIESSVAGTKVPKGRHLGGSTRSFTLGISGLSGLFLSQTRSLVSSRMAKSKASKVSKGKLRSKDLKISKCHRCFEGTVFRSIIYHSEALELEACFSVYVPDAPRMQTTLPYPEDCEEFPVLLFLSDEGCSDLDILLQGNILQHCADCGLILVSADTCARDGWDGEASYYVNATEKPRSSHGRMRDYLGEVLDLVHEKFPTCGPEWVSIMGHGMGGTGALAMALGNGGRPFCSVSALAPMLNPMGVEVTKTALRTLLGEDESTWRKYDPLACVLDSRAGESAPPILLDVGAEEGSSYVRDTLKPFDFLNACHEKGIPVDFRLRAGFDHTVFFVSSVMEEHIDFHSKHLDDA